MTRDLVVASLEAWDTVWRRNQHLVSRLLRDDPSLRVLFVEPPADPSHAVRRRARPHRGAGLRLGPHLDGVEPGRLHLYQGTKALPRRVDPHADARLADRVVRAADELGFDDPLLWVNDPSAATLLARTGWRSLYDVTDDWLHAGHTGREHERLVADEALLLRDAAHVVVCSPALLAAKSGDREGRPLSLVPNAVDVDAYRTPGPRPADLPDGPVALYVGTVHRDRVDLDLCARTARVLAGRASVVLVGPAPLDPAGRRGLEGAGVLLLGPRDATHVPAYLTHADVLLVPHVVTPFTDSLDPIKLYEYRAADRPVVSTRVAGFRDSEDPRVVLADPEHFPETVAATVKSPPPTALSREMATPETPSWAVRTVTMRSVLNDVAASRAVSRAPYRRYRARLPHPAGRRRAGRPGDAPGVPGRDDLHDALRAGAHLPGVPERPDRHVGTQRRPPAATAPSERPAAAAPGGAVDADHRGRRARLEQRLGPRLLGQRPAAGLLPCAGPLALPGGGLPGGPITVSRCGAWPC